MKDWTGNSKSVFQTLGASNHAIEERETYDYYATEPKATELLLKLENFDHEIWECACGQGHISDVLKKHGYNVKSTDIINRGYGEGIQDFLSIDVQNWDGDIITNPPYKYALKFVYKALSIVPIGNKIALFMGIQFLEGKERRHFFKDFPPYKIYVSSSRLNCAKNGNFEKFGFNSARCYAWYIWKRGFKGDTVLKWFN